MLTDVSQSHHYEESSMTVYTYHYIYNYCTVFHKFLQENVISQETELLTGAINQFFFLQSECMLLVASQWNKIWQACSYTF